MSETNYEVIQIDEDTWSIEDGGIVRFFLLKGTEKALLIDSGMHVEQVKELAKRLLKEAGAFAGTEPVIELLNTHADGDHCFGNKEFDWFYLHEADWPHYEKQFGKGAEIRPVKEGDVIDLGDRPLEIIEIPGHTFGSIAILDVNRRVLYSGDSVQDGRIFLFGAHRDLEAFPEALLKLDAMTDQFDAIYASHETLKLEPDQIGEVFDACEAVFHGEVQPEEIDLFGNPVHAYDCGTVTLLIDKDRVFEESDPEEA